jgi:hypothetical protein
MNQQKPEKLKPIYGADVEGALSDMAYSAPGFIPLLVFFWR